MRKFLLVAILFSFHVQAQTLKNISLEDVWKDYTFRVKDVPGFSAMKDGKYYTQLDAEKKHQYIRVYNLATGGVEKTLFDNATQSIAGKELSVDNYEFSADEQKMLLYTEGEHIYRRSILYRVYVYDIKTGSLNLLDYDKVLHATFSPDGSKVAFVKNNNLYYKDLASGETMPITKDGEKNKIINGNCDWVYEEEFEFTRAFDWAPDGKNIAFYRFDESLVPEYTIPMYHALYPDMDTYKYPKAGERNSLVEIKIYNLADGKTINVNVGKETDQYIPRIKWIDAESLCVYRMNRLQNKLELLAAAIPDGKTKQIYREESKTYVEINDNIQFLPGGHSFILNSERSGYNHLYRWNWEKQRLTAITSGDFDVDQLVGVDTEHHLVYYTAAAPTPLQRKLYVADWNGKNTKCLTPEKGYHSITPCLGYNYFLDKYSKINTPAVYYLRDSKGKIVRTLEDNHALNEKRAEYAMGNVRLIKVKGVTEKLNAWIMTPPGFDSTKKYPVLMYQYSGPGSQEVTDGFPARANDYFWYQMLAEKGYIIVCADGTGTGFRGEAFKKKTYLQLGKYESDDQIAVARYLGTLPFVDKDRIGIWGWSFGAFTSSTCLFKGNDVFKMAIAVAPVTNWRYYDNIYTERYMRRPQENEKGYDDNAPEKMAGNLKGKFLLIHGTADDNVHFQNSVMLVDAMIKANKEFDSEYYPNKNHGIYGGITRYHLYHRMTKFILENL
ncbi:MAG: S9 family peptidase [Flavipsychrobacter sp.]|nr:S9 family peptidase [Flavipsychrobacter sp.]